MDVAEGTRKRVKLSLLVIEGIGVQSVTKAKFVLIWL